MTAKLSNRLPLLRDDDDNLAGPRSSEMLRVRARSDTVAIGGAAVAALLAFILITLTIILSTETSADSQVSILYAFQVVHFCHFLIVLLVGGWLLVKLLRRMVTSTNLTDRTPDRHAGVLAVLLGICCCGNVMYIIVQLVSPQPGVLWSSFAEDGWTIVESITIAAVLIWLEFSTHLSTHFRRAKAVLLPAILGVSVSVLILDVIGVNTYQNTTNTTFMAQISMVMGATFRTACLLLSADHGLRTINDILLRPNRHVSRELLDGPLQQGSGQWRTIPVAGAGAGGGGGDELGHDSSFVPSELQRAASRSRVAAAAIALDSSAHARPASTHARNATAEPLPPWVRGSVRFTEGSHLTYVAPALRPASRADMSAAAYGLVGAHSRGFTLGSTGSVAAAVAGASLGGHRTLLAAPEHPYEGAEHDHDDDEEVALPLVAQRVQEDASAAALAVIESISHNTAARTALFGRRPCVSVVSGLCCTVLFLLAFPGAVIDQSSPLLRRVYETSLLLQALLNLGGFALFGLLSYRAGWMRPLEVPYHLWARDLPSMSAVLRCFLPALGAAVFNMLFNWGADHFRDAIAGALILCALAQGGIASYMLANSPLSIVLTGRGARSCDSPLAASALGAGSSDPATSAGAGAVGGSGGPPNLLGVAPSTHSRPVSAATTATLPVHSPTASGNTVTTVTLAAGGVAGMRLSGSLDSATGLALTPAQLAQQAAIEAAIQWLAALNLTFNLTMLMLPVVPGAQDFQLEDPTLSLGARALAAFFYAFSIGFAAHLRNMFQILTPEELALRSSAVNLLYVTEVPTAAAALVRALAVQAPPAAPVASGSMPVSRAGSSRTSATNGPAAGAAAGVSGRPPLAPISGGAAKQHSGVVQQPTPLAAEMASMSRSSLSLAPGQDPRQQQLPLAPVSALSPSNSALPLSPTERGSARGSAAAEPQPFTRSATTLLSPLVAPPASQLVAQQSRDRLPQSHGAPSDAAVAAEAGLDGASSAPAVAAFTGLQAHSRVVSAISHRPSSSGDALTAAAAASATGLSESAAFPAHAGSYGGAGRGGEGYSFRDPHMMRMESSDSGVHGYQLSSLLQAYASDRGHLDPDTAATLFPSMHMHGADAHEAHPRTRHSRLSSAHGSHVPYPTGSGRNLHGGYDAAALDLAADGRAVSVDFDAVPLTHTHGQLDDAEDSFSGAQQEGRALLGQHPPAGGGMRRGGARGSANSLVDISLAMAHAAGNDSDGFGALPISGTVIIGHSTGDTLHSEGR
jgi:hypothetical protein